MNPTQKDYFKENKVGKWLKRNKLHFLVWALFIFWETGVVGLMLGNFGNGSLFVAHYIVIICLFYFQSELLLPNAVKGNRLDFLRVPIVLFIHLVIYVSLHFAADVVLTLVKLIPYRLDYGFDHQFVLRNLYRGIFFMGFSAGYYFLKRYFSERDKALNQEREKLEAIILQRNTEQQLFKAQNAFLKAQINPHFLFNTLNFIYNKVSSSSPEAADAVLSLSEMMRYAITSDEMGGTIKLEDEMEQTINLISLFKIRRNQPLYLRTEFAENTRNLRFIPLVLLTLAENMFKHGQLSEAAHEATLKVFIENEILFFESRNLIYPQQSDRPSTGLLNIKDRLNYAYGNQMGFYHTTDIHQYFTLKVGVPLSQLNEPVR